MEAPKIIAEMCCNHMGNLNIAKKMIDAASVIGVDYAKFQKWCPKKALTREQYNAKHPDEKNAFSQPYGAHREALEFDVNTHWELKNYCRAKGIGYSCSVFDSTSASEMAELEPDYIKIPSQKNLDISIYESICDTFYGDIHISTGMTTNEQVKKLLDFLSKIISLDRVVLYAETSSYPCRFEDLSLNRIKYFREKYGVKTKAIGFSGHHDGIAPDIAAMALGADYIERHFTLDRSWKGTDQCASLAIPGLAKLKRDLTNCALALCDRPHGIVKSEQDAYMKVKQRDAEQFDAIV